MHLQDGKPDSTLRDRGDPGYSIGDIWNEILISHGAPKEKYSKKVRKVRMAGPQDLSPEQLNFINDGLKKEKVYLLLVDEHSAPRKISATLSSKQQDILSDLTKTRNAIDEYSGLKEDIDQLGEDEQPYIEMLRKEYFNDIIEAVRAGLIWHPLVFEFIYTYKVLGNKEILRAIKRGWETGVRRPIKEKDIMFRLYLDKIVKDRNAGKTWKELRRDLMKRKIIGKMSPQWLEKKVKKAWQTTWEKTGSKAPPLR